MQNWLESVYSDGTEYFVSNPLPIRGEEISIYLRMYEVSPVNYVFLRSAVNGAENLILMEKDRIENGLAYYKANITIVEDMLHYHFYLVLENMIYYYTQKNITTFIPDHTYDFKILAGYEAPEWVKESVFYQIFPDRFYNGNKENDVKTGEYTFNGHDTLQIKDWNQPALKYEDGFCMDFFGGDLEGVKNKINYLKKLGVNAVYLNPIFYAATIHKYDCLDYFEVDPHFGGDDALAELSEALHAEGMKLILDISINHTGTANKWFNKEGTFFDKSIGAYHNKTTKERKYYFFDGDTDNYKTWFDFETLPTLNYTSQELRNIIYRDENSVLKKWLKPPYQIDGWRFDVADVMARNNEIQLQHEVWPEIRRSIKDVNPSAYLLAEDWGDCAEYLQGDEWDAPMNYYGCTRIIRQFAGETDLFLERNEKLREIKYKPTANDMSNRIMEHLAKLPTVIQQNQFNLLDSHDTHRLHNNKNVCWQDYKGSVIMLFTLIGATCIYYGDEAEIDGRTEDTEGFRYPMPWDKNFEQGKFYELYSKLAHIKRENIAFSKGSFKIISDEDHVLSYVRFAGDQVWVIVCSNDDSERKVRIPIEAFGIHGFSKSEDALGIKLEFELESDHTMILNVPPHSSYIVQLQ
ncbi:MAG: alpha-amylase family glycosyl hydrolase [Mobilitalea sp.]